MKKRCWKDVPDAAGGDLRAPDRPGAAPGRAIIRGEIILPWYRDAR